MAGIEKKGGPVVFTQIMPNEFVNVPKQIRTASVTSVKATAL
jgi:hypothetical protein